MIAQFDFQVLNFRSRCEYSLFIFLIVVERNVNNGRPRSFFPSVQALVARPRSKTPSKAATTPARCVGGMGAEEANTYIYRWRWYIIAVIIISPPFYSSSSSRHLFISCRKTKTPSRTKSPAKSPAKTPATATRRSVRSRA